jgi:hypothetical protein
MKWSFAEHQFLVFRRYIQSSCNNLKVLTFFNRLIRNSISHGFEKVLNQQNLTIFKSLNLLRSCFDFNNMPYYMKIGILYTKYQTNWNILDLDHFAWLSHRLALKVIFPVYRFRLTINMIFWRKIVIFHTKYPKNVRASLRSARFF